MRTVTHHTSVDLAPDDVFGLLAAFDRYPELAPSVIRVVVTNPSHDEQGRLASCSSTWEVTFRSGRLHWTERDRFDPDRRVIAFEQTDGDLEAFTGSWTVEPAPGGGARVVFEACFDLGLPGLAEFLEPVAERALVANIAEILHRLFGTPADAEQAG